MKALDTNVLVYAKIRTSRHHETAIELLTDLANGGAPWAIPWPCLYEYLRVVTHPRVFRPPVPTERALADLERILASPSLVLLGETERHRELFAGMIREGAARGNLIFDAHIATLCLEHGVSEILTADRDFARFPGIRAVNPFG